MKKGLLKAGRVISLTLGILMVAIVLILSIGSKSTPASSLAVVWGVLGIPGIILLIVSYLLSKKYKRDFPKTQADIDQERHIKEVNANIREREKIANAERKASRKKLAEKKKAEKELSELKKKEAKQRALEESKNNIFNASHVAGLPLAEGVLCNIHYGPDEFKIYGGGNNFHLPFEKVTDICIKTNEEIQKSYVSSVGGAVGGAVLFGPIGAMIGGRAKEKTAVNKTNYLIITYLKDDNINYIGFEVKDQFRLAQEWVSRFDPGCAATGKDIAL